MQQGHGIISSVLSVKSDTHHNARQSGGQISWGLCYTKCKACHNNLKKASMGFGIISDITQILHHIKKGKKKIKVGLHLRKSWFINSLLVNIIH